MDLVQQIAADLAGQIRQFRLLVFNDLCQTSQIANALWSNIARLVRIATKRVDQFGALVDQLFPDGTHTVITAV